MTLLIDKFKSHATFAEWLWSQETSSAAFEFVFLMKRIERIFPEPPSMFGCYDGRPGSRHMNERDALIRLLFQELQADATAVIALCHCWDRYCMEMQFNKADAES